MKKITDVELMKKCFLDAIEIAGREDARKAIAIELFRYRISGKNNGVLTRDEEYMLKLRHKWDLSPNDAYQVAKSIESVCDSFIDLKEDDIVVDKEKGIITFPPMPGEYGDCSAFNYRGSVFG